MNVNAIIIRNARVALGLSLREVAKRSDVEIVELGRIERGVSEGEPDELLRIFQVLTAATAERRPAPRPLPLERAQLAEHCYETYCAAFMQQKTLRPRHPGQMPLASWADQRDEIRRSWGAVADLVATAEAAEPPRCRAPITIETPQGLFDTECALAQGHSSPCGAFFAPEPPDAVEAMQGNLDDLMAPMPNQCDVCGRKSTEEAGSVCGMPQPDGERCKGTLLPVKTIS